MKNEWAHHNHVRPEEWPWKSFPPAEIACRGTGKLKIDRTAMDRLQRLRDDLGAPMIVVSGYRSPEHNRAVGGAKASQHMNGNAFDVSMANHDPAAFERAARSAGFTAFGHYPASGFMHIDTRSVPAMWHGRGGWFHPRQRFEPEPEPKPVREAIRDATVIVGAGAAAETALREAAPFLPGEWAGYAMLAAVVIGAAVAIWRVTRKRSAEPET